MPAMLWTRLAGAVAIATAVTALVSSASRVDVSVAMWRDTGGTSPSASQATTDPPAATCDLVATSRRGSLGVGTLEPPTGSPNDPEAVASVVAVGDVGDSGGLAGPVAQLVAQIDPHGLLLIGDNVHGQGGPQEFGKQFDPNWSGFRRIWMPVVGNHEYRTARAAGFREYFDRPSGPLYYRCWRVASWVIVALDSKRPRNKSQLAWLRAILASTKGVPKIVTWHRARYSSGFMGDQRGTRHLWNVVKNDPDVRLVLWAHDHDYERMSVPVAGGAPINAMVVGTGGGTLQEPTPRMIERPWREFFVDHTTGVLHLRLGHDSFAWSFIAVPGVVLDSGSRSF